MIVNYAKFIAFDDLIEEKVQIEIGGVPIIGFAQFYPTYSLEVGKIYPIELSLFFMDHDNMEEQYEKKYEIKQIYENSFPYSLCGKFENNIIKLGKFDIGDDKLKFFSKFNGKFVRLTVSRISVEFLEFEN